MVSKIRELDTRNVAAVVPGSDPKLKDEVVVFSAHWDHLGIGDPVNGDKIYNGAADNATGCAMILEMARAWSALSGRDYVSPDDVRAVAAPVLEHRILLRPESVPPALR